MHLPRTSDVDARIVAGGYVIVDDYGALPACRQAVDDLRQERGATASLLPIDWTNLVWHVV